MSDIDITISAKNQASQILDGVENATRVLTENIVEMGERSVKVGSQMDLGFDKVSDSLDAVSKSASVMGSSIMKGLRALADITIVIHGIKTVAGAVGDFIGGMENSVQAYQTQLEAARGSTEAQQQFAASFQKITNVGDEATLALMKTAEAMGVTKEQSDEVVSSAIGLAEAFGISQEEALKKTVQAINGNANAFAELLPAMRSIDEAAKRNQGAFAGLTEDQKRVAVEQEKLALINESAAGGLSRLAEDAQSTRGVMERSAGAFGDLSEKIGELFDPLYRFIHQGLAVFAETLQSTIQPAIDIVNGGFGSMAPAIEVGVVAFQKMAAVAGVAIEAIVNVLGTMTSAILGSSATSSSGLEMLSNTVDQVARFIIGAITFVEVTVSNLPTIWELAVTAIALRLETMRANIEHIFTTVLPTYIEWFGENALNLLQDYFNLYVTILTNFGEKVINFWSTIFDFISSGFDGGVSGLASKLGESMAGSLVEGFEAATQPLPDIAARQLTGAEQLLAGDLARIGTDLASQFSEKFNARVADLEVNVQGSVEIEPPDLAQISNINEQIKPKLQVDIQRLQADEQRLATRGASDDPTRMVAENTKATNDKLDKLPQQLANQLAPLINRDIDTVQFVEVG